jgi:predicted RNA-binding Zn-ribbon protein involved in translation (DUF1610 family)
VVERSPRRFFRVCNSETESDEEKQVRKFDCPKCGTSVSVVVRDQDGTTSLGGHGSVFGHDLAKCDNCKKQFTQPEIDERLETAAALLPL